MRLQVRPPPSLLLLQLLLAPGGQLREEEGEAAGGGEEEGEGEEGKEADLFYLQTSFSQQRQQRRDSGDTRGPRATLRLPLSSETPRRSEEERSSAWVWSRELDYNAQFAGPFGDSETRSFQQTKQPVILFLFFFFWDHY